MTERKTPVETALDLLVYLPVGLAVTAAEEVPKLAAKGRTRVNTQLKMARVVGQFAVASARQQIESRLTAPPAPPSPPAASPSASASRAASPSRSPRAPSPAAPSPPVASSSPSTRRATSPSAYAPHAPSSPPASPPPAAGNGAVATPGQRGELAIPGYDSLSASQVVQRLAGLSRDELAAVAAYEEAHRARRTILNRANQLQGD